MGTTVGLYYPFIHFRDEEWLKVAALYWPRMCRIVPPDYQTKDSDAVKRLIDELDFVSNVSPTPATTVVGKRFLTFLQKNEGDLRERYGLSDAEAWKPDPVTLQQMGLEAQDASLAARLAHIYADKINPDLRESLFESGLAVHARGDPRWVGVHPKVAEVYMMVLAEEIANRSHLELVTDNTMGHLAVNGWTMSRLAQALLDAPTPDVPSRKGEEISEALAFIAFRFVLPKHKAIDVEKVIKIRQLYERDRGHFADRMADLSAELRSLEAVRDPQAFAAHLQAAYESRVGVELDALKRAMRDARVDAVFSAMNLRLKVPAILTSAAAIGGFIISPAAGLAAAVTVGLAQLTRSVSRGREKLMAESPAAYLLRVERELMPSSLLRRIGERLMRFLPGHDS